MKIEFLAKFSDAVLLATSWQPEELWNYRLYHIYMCLLPLSAELSR